MIRINASPIGYFILGPFSRYQKKNINSVTLNRNKIDESTQKNCHTHAHTYVHTGISLYRTCRSRQQNVHYCDFDFCFRPTITKCHSVRLPQPAATAPTNRAATQQIICMHTFKYIHTQTHEYMYMCAYAESAGRIVDTN